MVAGHEVCLGSASYGKEEIVKSIKAGGLQLWPGVGSRGRVESGVQNDYRVGIRSRGGGTGSGDGVGRGEGPVRCVGLRHLAGWQGQVGGGFGGRGGVGAEDKA